jgi:two-component system cell cycle response regulator
MTANIIKVLLIEDNSGDARLIQEALFESKYIQFELKWVDQLDAGIECITKDIYDVILLDLSLPDSHGMNTIINIREHTQTIPIVVLTGLDDEQVAIHAVQHGAQDYLIKGQVNSGLITRSLRYAIERHRMLDELYNLSIMDELTGLYNRRGFFNLAEQHLNTLGQDNRGFFVIVTDLDGMKQINDSYGHHMGNMALIDTTNSLKEVFHNSAIIARMGGDEFSIILPEDPEKDRDIYQMEAEIIAKMNEKLTGLNLIGGRAYQLSISLGLSRYNPDAPVTLGELIIQADHRMYSNKKEKLK